MTYIAVISAFEIPQLSREKFWYNCTINHTKHHNEECIDEINMLIKSLVVAVLALVALTILFCSCCSCMLCKICCCSPDTVVISERTGGYSRVNN